MNLHHFAQRTAYQQVLLILGMMHAVRVQVVMH